MLDREKYNLEKDAAIRSQVAELSVYLSRFIQTHSNIRERKIDNQPSEAVMEKIRNTPIGRGARDSKEVGRELVENVLDTSLSLKHPRFFSFVAGDVSPYALAGSFLSDLYNINAGGYSLAPAAATIEEKLIAWAAGRAGMDEKNAGGIFTSGGSLSNLTGMLAARECKLPGRYDLADAVAFCSTQAHSSVKKGMRLMGLRNDQILLIDCDRDFRIRTDLLEAAIQKSVAEGKKPFLLVGSVGTTNTGSIDPLDKMADLAEKYNLWLHVDGAYGGSILVSDIYRNLAKGIERADSFSWDFHKWMLQVYSCSCVVVKNKETLVKTFAEHPEYLQDVIQAEHTDGWDRGIEMSRPTRFLELWFTLQVLGTDQVADIVDYAFFNARTAEKEFLSLSGWEIVSEPSCGTLNVRYAPKGIDEGFYDEINQRISAEIIASGYAYIVTTILNGHKCLRLCMINGKTETCDVLNTVEKLDELAKSVAKDEKYKK